MRPKKLKHCLRPYGIRRGFFKKIPYIFLSLIVILIVAAASFLGSEIFISRETTFISPLAQIKTQSKSIKGELEYLLDKDNISFSKIETATDSSYLVFLKDNGQVSFASGKKLGPQVSSLQLILSRLTIEGKKFKRLDLRYELPTIEF